MSSLHVCDEVDLDQACFKISGGVAGKKCSWQLVAEAPPQAQPSSPKPKTT